MSEYWSRRYSNKSSEELDGITSSESFELDARLGAIEELKNRGENTEKHSLIETEILNKISFTTSNRINTNTKEKYQTFWRRLFAAIIDGLLLVPLGFVFSYFRSEQSISLNYLLDFINILAPYLYSVLLHGFYGQTIGKSALSIKVLDVSEKRNISMEQSLKRDLIPIIIAVIYFFLSFIPFKLTTEAIALQFILSMFPLVWVVLEIFTMLFNEKSRAIHDLIASSVVVRME